MTVRLGGKLLKREVFEHWAVAMLNWSLDGGLHPKVGLAAEFWQARGRVLIVFISAVQTWSSKRYILLYECHLRLCRADLRSGKA